MQKARAKRCQHVHKNISSSIQTILSVLEFHQILRLHARGLYRRSGISPCPEDIVIILLSKEE